MKILKAKGFMLLALAAGLNANAQVRFPVSNNDLRNNLEKVIGDFPNHFSNFRGDTIEVNPQSIEFASKLDFRMAPQNVIIQYKAQKPIYSWQALLLNTEDFGEAAKKYKWLYNQLKVMTIRMEGYSFSLSGEYDTPDESRTFCSSVFKLTPGASNLPKLKIEVAMQFEFPEWKVNLLVYEKEREDKERGDVNGD